MIRSILWFRQDLRLHDNEALIEAIRSSDELIPVFIFNPDQFVPFTRYRTSKTGMARARFLLECVVDLKNQLVNLSSDLVIRTGKPEEVLYQLALDYKVQYVFCNRERTHEEVAVQDRLERNLWSIGREMRFSRGKMLYHTADLPFPVTHCPDSFAVFKKETDQFIPVRAPLPVPEKIPPFPGDIDAGLMPDLDSLISESIPEQLPIFKGGETEGLKALDEGISLPPAFLENDNNLLSPWIAMGCLSPKKVYYDSFSFQNGDEIQQQLIYRDYLRLMGKKYGDKIFYRSGIRRIPMQFKVDKTLLRNWQQGETGIDIIDAAMKQLNHTGWLPDSLRRLVMGYFVKVLQLDWMMGAAYFESRLVDYDPCTNWVSWLNMAGLGPDTREDRIINYDAVGKKLDPDGHYVHAWNPEYSD